MVVWLDTDPSTGNTARTTNRLRGVHDTDLCADHLVVQFAQRTEVARSIELFRTRLAVAADAQRWAFDHLWNRRLDQVVAPAAPPSPLSTVLFLARPWSGQWRWAAPPTLGPSSAERAEAGTTIDHVVALLGESGRAQLVDLIAGADDTVRECHLDQRPPGDQDPRVPAVILARRLGATEDPLVIGVWISAVQPHDG